MSWQVNRWALRVSAGQERAWHVSGRGLISAVRHFQTICDAFLQLNSSNVRSPTYVHKGIQSQLLNMPSHRLLLCVFRLIWAGACMHLRLECVRTCMFLCVLSVCTPSCICVLLPSEWVWDLRFLTVSSYLRLSEPQPADHCEIHTEWEREREIQSSLLTIP